jgi:hypothetical protein
MTKICSVPGCGRKYRQYGYCELHRSRYRKKVAKLKAQGTYREGMPIDVGGPGRLRAPPRGVGSESWARHQIAQAEAKLKYHQDETLRLERTIQSLRSLLP